MYVYSYARIMRKNCHCLSDYVDILKLNLVERRLQIHSYTAALSDGKTALGYQPPPLTSSYIPVNKEQLVTTRRTRFARWNARHQDGTLENLCSFQMGKFYGLWQQRKLGELSDFSFQVDAISKGQTGDMQYVDRLCKMKYNSYSIICLHFTSFYFISCCYFVNVKYTVLLWFW